MTFGVNFNFNYAKNEVKRRRRCTIYIFFAISNYNNVDLGSFLEHFLGPISDFSLNSQFFFGICQYLIIVALFNSKGSLSSFPPLRSLIQILCSSSSCFVYGCSELALFMRGINHLRFCQKAIRCFVKSPNLTFFFFGIFFSLFLIFLSLFPYNKMIIFSGE